MSVAEDDVQKTVLWWRLLRGVAVFNLGAWLGTAAWVSSEDGAVRAQLGLSLVYVLVCGFRSFWPRIDLERTCIVDSPVSSMVAGRSAATVAEVCFATQVGLLVALVGSAAGVGWVAALGPVVVVLLSVAQVCCWWSVLTLSHLGHAVEESIWAVVFALVGGALWVCAPELEGVLGVVPWVGVPLCLGYVVFMGLVDVPMYVGRWREGRRTGRRTLGLRAGLHDALHRRHPTRSWAVWRPEVAWLTGYFSGAVWVSLALVHLVDAAT